MENWERVAAFLLAGLIVFLARRKRILSRSGAFAAFVVGAICAAAGVDWAALLVMFFVSANMLSRYRRAARSARIDDIVEKGNERDAWQVVANGGVFAAAAAASIIDPSAVWLGAGAGAIAAVTSDTWSTEIGTVAQEQPRIITTGARVPAGTSGGVTLAGSLAALAGALAAALATLIAGWGIRASASAMIGGIAGSLVDSIAGATIQRRRWCEQCGKSTERLVHICGTVTQPAGGVRWIGNDAVNGIAAVTGAIVGLILSL